MPASVTATVEELPESRVRVQAEVAPHEVEKRLQQAAKALGRDMRVPGFRQGKVPPPVIIKRIGREAVLDEAVRESLGEWYGAAIDAAALHPVGDPSLDLGELPGAGEPLTFSFEVGVRPRAELGGYKGLEVPRPEAAVPGEEIDAEVERLRERLAKLETVDRPAQIGDFLVADFVGSIGGTPFAGGEARDQLLELGANRLVPGFEEQLQGAVAGEQREITVTFPQDYRATELAGKEAQFAVSVKEVKAKDLPALDDDFALDAAGFDSMEELRGDIETRLREGHEAQAEEAFREGALDAVVERATIDLPQPLVHARAHELWHQMEHQLSQQGITKDVYLRMSGKQDEHELIDELEPEAEKALRREAVLAAIIEAEQITVSDDEVLAWLEESGQGGNQKKLLERLRSQGRLEQVKEDLSARRALDLVIESATPVPAPAPAASGAGS